VNGNLDIRILGGTAGRALYIGPAGEVYVAKRYRVYRSDDWGAHWQLDCHVPDPVGKSLIARSRLGARLLRYYIAAFEVLGDGSRIAVARDGVYRAGPGETRMSRVFHLTRGSRPLNLAVDGNRVLFGEYGNLDRYEVFLYVSEDGGRTFDVGHRFPKGDIRHVHNVLVDPYRDGYWVFVGDYDRQPGIGSLSKDMQSLEWLNRGGQKYRAARALVKPDCLIYGTDSDCHQNSIVRLDKQTGKVHDLLDVEGSSLYATTFGPVHAISTCVEVNSASVSRECSLYTSLDCTDWKRVAVHKKDPYHARYFQFGTIVLPYAYHTEPRGMYSGQAIERMDDKVCFMQFSGRNNDWDSKTGLR
jgi:hypothetical protein